MNRWQVEQVFDDLREGRINEFDAESELRRIDSSSCMHNPINKIIRDVEYGFRDSYDAMRDFEIAQQSCEIKRRERDQEEREYWGY